MHYRKKEARNEAKEREAKIKAQKFHDAVSKFINLRLSGHKDLEFLRGIENLLQISPEFVVLWHYRKEILIDFAKSIDTTIDEQIEDNKGDSRNDLLLKLDSLCSNELNFIENCLKISPKSYATWHHRVWLIQFMNHPDYQKEINLCNQCLQLDERNFHCWNYRRFIVKLAKIPTIEEFNFTTKKIDDNFSNFSSWHYRSYLYKKLLDENQDINVIKSMIEKDLIMVKNAIFTDPNDQSPWLYLRWLLNHQKMLEKPISVAAKIKRLLLFREVNQSYCLTLEFTKPLRSIAINAIQIEIDECPSSITDFKIIADGYIYKIQIDFNPIENNHHHHRLIVKFDEETIEQTFQIIDQIDCQVYLERNLSDQSQIENFDSKIEDLLILLEIEPDSKWPNYMLYMLSEIKIRSKQI
ncbi:Geranylgeranyl transferase type-2 subunit alpha [Sarcoptes scabiei]|uniref:Geranylgeranyl transferase type-2 subunit alpha n=1 Tax=Sarcoptes scabiei TaxID=52283 RepID=A0A834VD74_SARSC|nr:Geranylgeranyl transferase type-2 subunit alpha [Sarcoptes scabiei]